MIVGYWRELGSMPVVCEGGVLLGFSKCLPVACDGGVLGIKSLHTENFS